MPDRSRRSILPVAGGPSGRPTRSQLEAIVILGIGTDLVEIARVERMLERHPDRSQAKIFTAGEIDYCRRSQRPYESFAARFAAKEAFFKALGTGWRSGVAWKEVEVVREDGAPFLRLHGESAATAEKLGMVHSHLTLSHTDTMACAFVIIEGRPRTGGPI